MTSKEKSTVSTHNTQAMPQGIAIDNTSKVEKEPTMTDAENGMVHADDTHTLPQGSTADPTSPHDTSQMLDDELDHKLIALRLALDAFEGIVTSGGGRPDPSDPEEAWSVTFQVEPSDDGWFALEFLAWVINNDYVRAGHNVQLTLRSAPPYVNCPGKTMVFAVVGAQEDPQRLADHLHQLRELVYISPEALEMDEDDDDDNDDEEICIRAKWRMDGARTLAEARQKLYEYAEHLEELGQQGYELIEPIEDDYGFVDKQ